MPSFPWSHRVGRCATILSVSCPHEAIPNTNSENTLLRNSVGVNNWDRFNVQGFEVIWLGCRLMNRHPRSLLVFDSPKQCQTPMPFVPTLSL